MMGLYVSEYEYEYEYVEEEEGSGELQTEWAKRVQVICSTCAQVGSKYAPNVLNIGKC